MSVLINSKRGHIVTKADLRAMETRLVKWTVGILIAVVLAMLGNLGALMVLIFRLSGN